MHFFAFVCSGRDSMIPGKIRRVCVLLPGIAVLITLYGTQREAVGAGVGVAASAAAE